MTEHLIIYLEETVEIARVWGPVLIFVFMTVESSFLPFPSEIVMIPAGFMAARHELFPGTPLSAVVIAVLCGILGSLAGAYINYFISLKLGRAVLYRHGKCFFLKRESLERAEEIFREYGEVATFVCRLLPAIRQLISIPAGVARMNFFRFSLFTGLGAGIWMIVLTVIGYQFGMRTQDMSYADLVHRSKSLIHDHYVWLFGGCAAIVVGYVLIQRRIMHRRKAREADA